VATAVEVASLGRHVTNLRAGIVTVGWVEADVCRRRAASRLTWERPISSRGIDVMRSREGSTPIAEENSTPWSSWLSHAEGYITVN
jgi:hypothetical protein